MRSKLGFRGILLVATALSGTAPALSQTAATPDPAGAQQAQDEEPGLAEIVVTAERRSENLQRVPLSVAAVTADIARARGITRTEDLTAITPGLTLSNSNYGPTIYIRGVGTQNTVVGEEGSNSVYVDGVYQGAVASAIQTFNNIERVEVLKGPQGTLFGRNATGGLIHIITAKPKFDLGYNAEVGYSSYDTYEGRAYLTGPLTDQLAADLAVYGKNQTDGWGTNVATGNDASDGKIWALRGKLLWRPGEATEAVLTGDISRERQSFAGSSFLLPGILGLDGRPDVGFYNTNTEVDPTLKNRLYGASLNVTHEAGFAQLGSITAYRGFNQDYIADQDRTPLRTAALDSSQDGRQFTQELQIQSLSDSKVKWIVGVFYLNMYAEQTPLVISGTSQAARGGLIRQFARIKTESIAGYAQATVPLGPRTKVTAGLRGTKDIRRITGTSFTATNAVVVTGDQKQSWTEPTWRLALDHELFDRGLVYASYSRGYKSGVYNLLSPNLPAIDPETLDAYEVGFKSEFLDRRVRFNAAAFIYKYDDIQLSRAILGGTQLLNAAKATIKGADFDLTVAPVRGLTLTGALSLLDAEYDSFPNAPFSVPRPAVCPSQTPGPRTGGNLVCVGDASGTRMIRTPKYSFSLGADYRYTLTGGSTLSANVNYYQSGRYIFEPLGRIQQPVVNLLNAQLGFATPEDRFYVQVWGRNLTKERYYVNYQSTAGDVVVAQPPRTFGITLGVRR